MQARTERQLGIAAALALTAATFVMPGISTQVAQNETAQTGHVQIASSQALEGGQGFEGGQAFSTGLRHFVTMRNEAQKPIRYE